jgi:hypothetical protein
MVMQMTKFVERGYTDQLQVGTLDNAGWGSTPGNDTYTYDAVNVVPCKLDEGTTESSFETVDGGETEYGDATICAPQSNTSITLQSRLKLMRRHRKNLTTPKYWRVVGINETDSARLVFVKRVTGNATR